jgi:hypothetical protein
MTNHSWQDADVNIYIVEEILTSGNTTFFSEQTFLGDSSTVLVDI